LVCSLSVVPFEVILQMTWPIESGLASFRRADIRTEVLVVHPVVLHVPPFFEVGPAVRDLALVRSLTGVNPLVLYDTLRVNRLAALPEPAENFSVLELLPLRCPAFANRGRWRWTDPLRAGSPRGRRRAGSL
jgi:hypothetical protein